MSDIGNLEEFESFEADDDQIDSPQQQPPQAKKTKRKVVPKVFQSCSDDDCRKLSICRSATTKHLGFLVRRIQNENQS